MSEVSEIKRQLRLNEWKQVISDCHNSGLSVEKWTSMNGISRNTYYYWLRKLRTKACESLPIVEATPSEPMFTKLDIPSVHSIQPAILLNLGRAKVEINNGADESTIEAVIKSLNGIC